MCGRFTLRTPAAELVEIFHVVRSIELEPRYNIAPTQPIAIVRAEPSGRVMTNVRWGLVPAWSSGPKQGPPMINARAETAARRPAFRDSFRQRRCLVPADGFFEWRKTEGRTKEPCYIRLQSGRPFAFAGLWDAWRPGPSAAGAGAESARPPAEEARLESCTILTTDANALLHDLHDRMPVILRPQDYDRWLDPSLADVAELEALLAPYPSDEMKVEPVSTLVNNARNDSPECIRPVGRSRSLFE
jgi:putative SOS response-associated peptidase YedK